MKRLQFCKKFEKNLSIFVQICREKKVFEGNIEGNKKRNEFRSFFYYMCKNVVTFSLGKMFPTKNVPNSP